MILAFVAFLILNKDKSDKLANVGHELHQKNDSLKVLKAIKDDEISCIAESQSYNDPDNGYTMMKFTFKVNDSVLVSKLRSVDYFFDNAKYNPQHKISNDSANSFRLSYFGSICIGLVKVCLHYKDQPGIDTVFFPMCAKTRAAIKEVNP